MVRSLFSVFALLMGSGLLVLAGGLNGLLLPVRGEAEGFSAATLGLLGTGWAIGYVVGCLRTPYIVARVGHIRAFGVMCSVAAMAVLFCLLVVHPAAWIPARALQGFCFAAAAMIVESWLNERAQTSNRGRIFGAYTMINLGATTIGQALITLGNPGGFALFVVAAMIYCMALLPTAMSASATPRPLTQVTLNLPALWRNSPIAVFAVAMLGVSNGAFGTLGAVFAARLNFEIVQIALFTSLPILTSAAMQLPVGMLSDRFDRRVVLIGTALMALAVETTILFSGVTDQRTLIVLACVFGAAIYAMYPIVVAHASDHVTDGNFLQISGGLLMIYGLGAIVGPSLAGFAMTRFGPAGLFAVSAGAHVLLILFAISRIYLRQSSTPEEKGTFQAAPLARVMTPETLAMTEQALKEQAFDDVSGPENAETPKS